MYVFLFYLVSCGPALCDLLAIREVLGECQNQPASYSETDEAVSGEKITTFSVCRAQIVTGRTLSPRAPGKRKRGPLKMHSFSSDLWVDLVPLSDTKTNKEVQTCRLHKQGYLATTVSREPG